MKIKIKIKTKTSKMLKFKLNERDNLNNVRILPCSVILKVIQFTLNKAFSPQRNTFLVQKCAKRL